jgi:hypothetical protein
MATKAERFRYELERSGEHKPPGGSKAPMSDGAALADGARRRKPGRQKAAAPLKNKQLLGLLSPHNRHDHGMRAGVARG